MIPHSVGAPSVSLGIVIVALWRVHAVCAKTRPFREEPVLNTAAVLTNMMPSTCDVVPTSTSPATCQTMFLACAPSRSMFTAEATITEPVVCTIKTSFSSPWKVMSCTMLTSVSIK